LFIGPVFVIKPAMRNIVIGTAGHVDHGKTSLVRALTGIDTDRLKEEKERGITIELGFAPWRLPGGIRAGIVDVPGHERFVRTMVAGASGVDLVVLVIAADEGVMPQTREHLEICSLLGIRQGIVALTKIDLVDKEWLELVEGEVREFLEGTILDGVPVMPLSVITGEGLPEFVAAVASLAAAAGDSSDAGVLRLPVDRVFTMKGFGTILTGTVLSGTANVGDSLEVMPAGRLVKVRGIQVYHQTAALAQRGQRAALNIQGIDREMVERGDVLALPGYLAASRRVTVYLEYLPGWPRPLKHRSPVRFHTGTAEVTACLSLLDQEELRPGEKALAQLYLARPLACVATDRFVIRSLSPVATIGGGSVIDPVARRQKRFSSAALEALGRSRSGRIEERLVAVISQAGPAGIDTRGLFAKTGLSPDAIALALRPLLDRGEVVDVHPEEGRLVAPAAIQMMQEKIRSFLADYHGKFPLSDGAAKEEVRGILPPGISSRLFHWALRDLELKGEIVVDRQTLKARSHRVDLDDKLITVRQEMLSASSGFGLTPPTEREWAAFLAPWGQRGREIFPLLLKEGLLVRIKEGFYLHHEVLAGLESRYRDLLAVKGGVSPQDFKDLTGLSRKYVIPLMEYFDMVKLTIRVGDIRRPTGRAARGEPGERR
jgi:selenocysteine-specific elongation factor